MVPLGDEPRASTGDLLLSAFDDGTGQLAAGFLRHLSTELYLLSLKFSRPLYREHGPPDPITIEGYLHRLADQARSIAELQLRLVHQPRAPDPTV